MLELRANLKRGYDVDGDLLGLGSDEAREGKFLGRLVRYTASGLEWEADPKQVTALISEFGLECGSGVDTPGVKNETEESTIPMATSRPPNPIPTPSP